MRFTFVNVDSGRPDAVVLQSCCQSGLVDEAATGCVDEKGSWSHLLYGVLVNQVMVVLI